MPARPTPPAVPAHRRRRAAHRAPAMPRGPRRVGGEPALERKSSSAREHLLPRQRDAGQRQGGRDLGQLVRERARRHVQPDPEHGPALLWPPLHQDSRRPSPLDPDVVRPFDLRRHRAIALGHGDARPRNGSSSSSERSTSGQQQRRARGARPRAPLPAAAGGLLVRGHQRPVRRARGASCLARSLVESVTPVMDARQPDHRGRSTTVASGVSPSAAAALPRFTATPIIGRSPRRASRSPGADVRERLDERRDEPLAAATSISTGFAERRAPSPRRSRVRDVERRVAEAVHEQDVRHDLSLADRRLGQLQQRSSSGSTCWPASASSAPARQMRRDGREDVAPVEGGRHRLEPVRRAAMSTASTTPPQRSQARLQQAVVGPDEQRAVAACERPAPRRSRAHLRVDDRDVHARRHVGQRVAQHERARAHAVARDAVREVDDRDAGRDPRITPWQTPTNSSSWP